MKALLLTILLLTLYSTTSAQNPSVVAGTPIAQPNAEQKASLLKLAQTWDAAIKAAETARDKYLIALFSIEAELGLKPSEVSVQLDPKGELIFVRTPKPVTVPAKPKE